MGIGKGLTFAADRFGIFGVGMGGLRWGDKIPSRCLKLQREWEGVKISNLLKLMGELKKSFAAIDLRCALQQW